MPAKKKTVRKVVRPVNVVERRVVKRSMKLDAFKFGIAGGILGALFIVLTTLSAMFGMFPLWTELIIDMYGAFGYSVSALGVLLGAIYGFIDCFICMGLFAVIYNWLT